MPAPSSAKLARDLLNHAIAQLTKIARRHVREGKGPATASYAAIRETAALFPVGWRLGVQGDDKDVLVEVWEVDHKYPLPIARIRSR